MKEAGVLLLFAVTLCRSAHKKCSIESQLTPHENCNQYYQCVNGALIVRNCYSTLYFNPKTQYCDWPANVDCSNDGDENNEVNRCTSGKAEGLFIVHENCNQYYRCVHRKLIAYTCHPDLLFNSETLQCDWPYNVDCNAVTQFPDTDTDTTDKNENPVTETENPDVDVTPSDSCESAEDKEDDSSVETSESNEEGSNEETSESNEEGNIDTSSESSEEDSSRSDSNEDVSSEDNVNKICAAENAEGLLISHEDCSKFYVCSGGKPVVMDCPPNLLYNSDTEQCDWAKNVDCGNNRRLLKKLEVIVDVTVRGKKSV